jgi:folate-binding protein YgfZ
LPDRGVVAVGGDDARHLLQNLVTCDLDNLMMGQAAYGALLTPQGKLQFDFILYAIDGGFLFDLPRSLVADFVKRLTLYKLRAAVDIDDGSDALDVIAFWHGSLALAESFIVADDPRLTALGGRAIVTKDAAIPADGETDPSAYERHRIALGVPEGGVDFAYGDVFPHDVDLDQLAGVAFDKGCFVGQEVVSRMENRGTARRRVVKVEADGELASGADVTAGDQAIGRIGSVAGSTGLAMVRLDRAAAAKEAGTPITAGERTLSLTIPSWARFDWPQPATGD